MLIEKIKSLRKAMGLTQVELSQKAGVSLPTIQNIEALKANPSLQVLEKILLALNAELRIASTSENLNIIDYFNMDLSQFKTIDFKQALDKLITSSKHHLKDRELDLQVALYASLLDHYANWLKSQKYFNSVKSTYRTLAEDVDRNRLIKYRRIWLAKVSQVI